MNLTTITGEGPIMISSWDLPEAGLDRTIAVPRLPSLWHGTRNRECRRA